MDCPLCESETHVVYCYIKSLRDRRRRRECKKCKHRFTTIEIPVEDYVLLKEANVELKHIIKLGNTYGNPTE